MNESQAQRRRPWQWLLLLVLLLFLVIFLAAEFGLQATEPTNIEARIAARATANYSPWDPVTFNRLDPAIGTQIALDNLATANLSPEELAAYTATAIQMQTDIATTGTPDVNNPTATVPVVLLNPTVTPEPSNTLSGTISPTPTPLASETQTATTTATTTITSTATTTVTPTATVTSTPTPTATNTLTATATVTPTPTNTNVPPPTAVPPDPPVAGFTWLQSTSGVRQVIFNSTSTGDINTYTWDFGDGNTASDASPSRSYATSQTYTVTLTVSGPSGTDTATRTVTVYDPPQISFTHNQITTTTPFEVQFNSVASGGPINTYTWTFGDGSPTSNTADPTHSYASGGFYAVTLTVSGPGGSDSAFSNIQIVETFAPPIANFSADVIEGGVPLTVNFTDLSSGNISGRNWNFGDGATSADINPQHTYTTTGTFTVTLNINGPGGSDTASTTIRVLPEPVAFFTYTIDPAQPLTVNFTDASTGTINTYNWDFGDGSGTSNAQNPSYTFGTTGTYTVFLEVLGPGGTDTHFEVIDVATPPVAAFTWAQDPANPGRIEFTDASTNAVSYSWTFGDGATSTQANPFNIYAAPGTYDVTLTVEDNGGRIDSVTQTVTVSGAPVADFIWLQDPAGTFAIDFNSTSTGTITAYSWDFGDSNTGTGAAPAHTYAAAGTYTVTLTVSGPGGSDSASQTVTVEAAPVAGFTWLQDTATPLTIDFSSTSTGAITAYSWDFGDSNTGTGAAPAHTYAAAGTYTVTLTVSGPGGTDTATQTVTVLPGPVADIIVVTAPPLVINAPIEFANNSTGDIINYSWAFGNGDTSNAVTPAPVTYATAGTYTVTLEVSGPGGTDTATITVDIQTPPDLAVTKNVDENRPREGDQITYTITVTNNSAALATGVIVSDPPPSDLIFISANAPGGTTYISGTWTIGDLPGGESRTLNLTFEVGVLATFTVANAEKVNTATVTLDQNDPNTANNTDSVTIRVVEADLAVNIAVDNATPNPGDTVIYTLTVTNNGGRNATGVTLNSDIITDPAPDAITHVSDDGGGAYDPATGLWTVGALTAGATETLTINAQLGTGITQERITKTISVATSDQYDPINGNNNATVDVFIEVTNLRIVKSVSNNAPAPGADISYTIEARNAGPLDDTGITVTDNLPAGVSYTSDDSGGAYNPSTGVWTIGAMTANTTRTLTINVRVDDPPTVLTVTNTATISGALADFAPANNTDSATFTIPSAELGISKAVTPANASPGETVTYTLSMSNGGPQAASGVSVSEPLPAAVTYVSDTGGGAYDPATGIWTVGGLVNGGSATLTITATVNGAATAGATVTNTADIITSDQSDFNSADDSASASFTVPAVDLAISKSASPTVANRGDTVTYTVTVSNPSATNANGVEISDPLPASVNWQADDSGGIYNPATGSWAVGSIPAGGAATLNITVQVAASAPTGTVTNTASITTAEQLDPNIGNNTASADFIIPTVDIGMTKTADKAQAIPGETVVYTLTATNNSPTYPAQAVTVTDVLPGEVTYVTDSGGGAYDSATGLWNVGSIPAGGSATLTITVTVNGGLPGGTAVTNTASLNTLAEIDNSPGNDSASATFTVPAVDVGLTKTVDNAIPNTGDSITYTVTAINNGPDEATNVTVSDVLPAGVTHTGNSGGYDPATGVWNVGTLAASGGSATLNITVTVDATGGTVTNTASLVGVDQPDTNAANDSASVDFTVPQLDLGITKTVSSAYGAEVPGGEPLTYTLALTNTSAVYTATGVMVTDVLPANINFTTADPAYDPATGIWTVGTVTPGQSITLTIDATVDAAAPLNTTITNTATITAVDQADNNPANDSASVDILVPSADLSIALTISNPTPNPGDTITLNVAVTNIGPSDATNIVVGGETRAFLASGDTWALPPITQVIDPASTPTTETRTVDIISADQGDPDLSNNSDTQTITILDTNPAVSLSASNLTPSDGASVTLTLTAENLGPDDVTGAFVTLPLPPELIYVGDSSGGTTYDPATGIWTLGGLTAGAPALTLTIDTTVSAAAGTNIPLTATIDADQYDSDPANNVQSITISIP